MGGFASVCLCVVMEVTEPTVLQAGCLFVSVSYSGGATVWWPLVIVSERGSKLFGHGLGIPHLQTREKCLLSACVCAVLSSTRKRFFLHSFLCIFPHLFTHSLSLSLSFSFSLEHADQWCGCVISRSSRYSCSS